MAVIGFSKLPITGTPLDNDVEHRIADILLSLHVPIEKIFKESTLYELGCDSIKSIQFVHRLVNEFKLTKIDINTLRKHSFIQSLALYIQSILPHQ